MKTIIKWLFISVLCLHVDFARAQFSVNGSIGYQCWNNDNQCNFEQNGAVLNKAGTGTYNYYDAVRAEVNMRFFRYIGLDGILECEKLGAGFCDQAFFDRHHINRGAIDNKYKGKDNDQELEGFTGAVKHYLGTGLGISAYIPLLNPRDKNDFCLYFAGGLIRHFALGGAGPYTCTYHDAEDHEVLTLNTTFSPKFISSYEEIGVFMSNGTIQCKGGICYNTSHNIFMAGTYQDYNTDRRTVVASDRVTAKLDYVAFYVSLGLTLFDQEHSKKQKLAKEIAKMGRPMDPESKLPPNKEDSIAGLSQDSLGGRKLKIQQHVDVNVDSVRVYLWDQGIVDGDAVTIYLNGEEIYHNLELTGAKTAILLKLKPGENELVMYMEDEGSITPCTVSLIISSNNEEKAFHLSSDAEASGCAKIIYHPK